MRTVPPEYQRFGGRLKLGFGSLAKQQTDLCKAVDAHQAIRNHGRHKHPGHAIEPAHDHLVAATHRLGRNDARLNQFADALLRY